MSTWTARGCRGGRRWATWGAVLIGAASAPQAAVNGFHAPYAIPDSATAALGVLLTVAVLATAGRGGSQGTALMHCWPRPSIRDRGGAPRPAGRRTIPS
jgi:hypothetical protein